VPDEMPLPEGIRTNPYIGMNPPTTRQVDAEISDEIMRGILAREKERNELEARWAERQKRALVGAMLLLLALLLSVFFRRCDA